MRPNCIVEVHENIFWWILMVSDCLPCDPPKTRDWQFDKRWLGGLLVERRTSVSQIRGSIPGQVAAV